MLPVKHAKTTFMTYAFARGGAVVNIWVQDYKVQGSNANSILT